MKKYWSSPKFLSSYLGGLVLVVCAIGLLAPFAVKSMLDKSPSIGSLVCLFILLACLGYMVYMLLSEPLYGRYSVSEKGITLFCSGKQKIHTWDSFCEYGFLRAQPFRRKKDVFFVYCSDEPLDNKKKDSFWQKTRHEMKNIVYIQYNKEPFNKMLPYIPEYWQQVLRDEEAWILENMRFGEKLYHK